MSHSLTCLRENYKRAHGNFGGHTVYATIHFSSAYAIAFLCGTFAWIAAQIVVSVTEHTLYMCISILHKCASALDIGANPPKPLPPTVNPIAKIEDCTPRIKQTYI
ncbi:hypothetical protein GDO86_008666 [Hymenochirus boettgeri]|uniref:Uncharacterized protein n=1 Tax=Hymenochirus boettgeri TaxID=247094 RepID=A0A8T2J3Q4_9PIPI|nr:hypothetical protein GDO86_008666 [Hymenochirus boettgeri]